MKPKHNSDNTGSEPLDVQKHDPVSAEKVDEKIKKDDVTGQTATTLKEMKTRLKEVPHKSAATHHDKQQYTKTGRAKDKKSQA